MMKVFTCDDHAGHYPVGVASVIVAIDEASAVELLTEELYSQGLDPTLGFTLQELDLRVPKALVINNGDY
jgi:hypothetical protein